MILRNYEEIIKAVNKKQEFYMDLIELDAKTSKRIFDYLKINLSTNSKIIKIKKALYKVEVK